MPQLRWSAGALADLKRLHRFLLDKSPPAAGRAIAAIRSGVRILERHPEVGRSVETIGDNYREWPIAFGSAGYVVRYRVERREVVILAVRHERESG